MTSVCEKKISAEVWLIHAEQISLYKFYRIKEKTLDTAVDKTSQARHFKSMRIFVFS